MTTETKTDQCSQHSYGGGWGHPCGMRGKMVERGGKVYCRVHDPVTVLAKRELKEAQWKIEWAAQDARRAERKRAEDHAEACVKACEGINPAAIPGLLDAAKRVVAFKDGQVSDLDWAVDSARKAIALAAQVQG